MTNNEATPNVNDTTTDEEQELTELEIKMEKMDEAFPFYKFSSNPTDYDVLDEPLVNSNIARVYYKYKCYCCGTHIKEKEDFLIERDRPITTRDFYEECMKSWRYTADEVGCQHHFLEFIEIKNSKKDNIPMLVPVFGS